jgi:hypothetical protein
MMQVMRQYIVSSNQVETTDHWKPRDHRNATIRVAVPVLSSIVAFMISFWSTKAASTVLLLNIFFNVFNRSFDPIFHVLDKLGIGVNDD